MRRTQALRFLQTTLQIDVRRALDSSTEHQLAIDHGNISAQLAQQGQVEPHCTCWKNGVSSNSSLQRRTPIALMRCTHGVTRCCGALSCNQW